MRRVLVAYGSKYGATAEIAEALVASLRAGGLDVDVRPVGAVHDFDGYAAAVVGSAVYMGRWRGDALRFLRHHADWLEEHDVWLFSSGPVGEDDEDADEADVDRWTRPHKVQVLAGEVGAHEHVVFGGRVDEEHGFVRRRMAAGMPEASRDRRDWDQIETWAAGIAAALLVSPGPTARAARPAEGAARDVGAGAG